MKIFLIIEFLVLGAVEGIADILRSRRESYKKIKEKLQTNYL
jgi:hypothetical protein